MIKVIDRVILLLIKLFETKIAIEKQRLAGDRKDLDIIWD